MCTCILIPSLTLLEQYCSKTLDNIEDIVDQETDTQIVLFTQAKIVRHVILYKKVRALFSSYCCTTYPHCRSSLSTRVAVGVADFIVDSLVN